VTLFIAPIVEGQGEQLCVERLLWRIAQDASPGSRIQVNPPIRVKAGTFINDARERGRHVQLAAAKARTATRGVVLVLLDCEDDCPAELGPRLLGEVRLQAGGTPTVVALAYREYETWFVAAARSLRGVEGFASHAEPPIDPQGMRDAKGWLGRLMPNRYDPVSHQLAFTQKFDLAEARRVASFDRLYRKIAQLLAA